MVTKEEVIKELQEKNITECDNLKGFDWSYLSEQEKKEIDQKIFKNIKRNSEGWTIKEVCTIKGYGGIRGYESSELMLVHQSAKIEYDNEGFLKLDYRRILNKEMFTKQQWTELEQISAQNQLNSQVEQPPKQSSWWERAIIFFRSFINH